MRGLKKMIQEEHKMFKNIFRKTVLEKPAPEIGTEEEKNTDEAILEDLKVIRSYTNPSYRWIFQDWIHTMVYKSLCPISADVAERAADLWAFLSSPDTKDLSMAEISISTKILPSDFDKTIHTLRTTLDNISLNLYGLFGNSQEPFEIHKGPLSEYSYVFGSYGIPFEARFSMIRPRMYSNMIFGDDNPKHLPEPGCLVDLLISRGYWVRRVYGVYLDKEVSELTDIIGLHHENPIPVKWEKPGLYFIEKNYSPLTDGKTEEDCHVVYEQESLQFTYFDGEKYSPNAEAVSWASYEVVYPEFLKNIK